MKSGFLLCILSAFLGGVFAVALQLHLSGTVAGNSMATGSMAESVPSPNQYGGRGMAVRQEFPATALPAGMDGGYSPEELSNIAVYENVNQSVVNISTRAVRTVGFFGERVESEGSGSGWVLDLEGHIVTNHHVIAESDQIEVTLFNGQSVEARLVGTDPANDVAVLRVSVPQELLKPVQLGDSSNLRVGQRVYAIGNPFGLERTMTTGIISSLNRSLPAQDSARTIKNVIQLDAALNQGNSGGPLLDRQSRLIGMNTAIASKTGENTGVGFAVPVNTIRRVVPELIRNGRIVRASLGLGRVMEMDKGLLIIDVLPRGPSDRAGLVGALRIAEQRFGAVVRRMQYTDPTSADIIVSVDGQPTPKVDKLLEILDSYKPGQTVTVGILRKGRPVQVRVVLEEEE